MLHLTLMPDEVHLADLQRKIASQIDSAVLVSSTCSVYGPLWAREVPSTLEEDEDDTLDFWQRVTQHELLDLHFPLPGTCCITCFILSRVAAALATASCEALETGCSGVRPADSGRRIVTDEPLVSFVYLLS